METIIRLKYNELTPLLLEKIQHFFKGNDNLEIAIKSVDDFGLTDEETPELYEKRIIKSIDNLEHNRNIVTFTADEFDKHTQNL
ncbi:MAG: hypothetical protein IPO21_15195 [Bacteroidales bacterium]|nr:hypothetical protein [Bacteroidales bacterium]